MTAASRWKGLMGRSGSWAALPAPTGLPDSIRCRMLDMVCGRTMSLTVSGLAGTALSLIAFHRSGDGAALVWAVLFTAVLAVRLELTRRYIRSPSRIAAVRRWTALYGLGGIASCLMLGLGGWYAMRQPDQSVCIIAILVVSGTAGGLASRNAGLPRLASLQIVLLLAPLITGAFGMAMDLHAVLAAMLVILLAALISIVHRNYVHIRDLMLTEQGKAALAERFDAALDNLPMGVCMFDAAERLVVVNAAAAALCGLPPEALPNGLEMHHVHARIGLAGAPGPADATQPEIIVADGRILQLSRHPVRDGGSISLIEDVTERRRAEARVLHLARHDHLTGLASRADLPARLQAMLERGAAAGAGVALLHVDLDGFKSVNDLYGHKAGDALLRAVAQRLQGEIGSRGLVARLGADEFALALCPAGEEEEAASLAETIVVALGQPFEVGLERSLRVGAGVGVGLAGEGVGAALLLEHAELALRAAKRAGRDTVRVFHPAMAERLQARRDLEAELRDALAAGGAGLVLHYQPIVSLDTGRVVAREALIRWQHPRRGLVLPDEFIPIAEQSGLIVPLGRWVLEQACRDASGWKDGARVAVNVSPAQLGDAGELLRAVTHALTAAGLASSRLEAEVTESALLVDDPQTLSELRRLAALGVRIALDDFGTGYSSLSHLRALPFNKIKIDGSFVRDALARPDCAAIVHAVAELGARLGVSTVAEAVETEEQLEFARREGCTEGQGYLFGRPVPASEAALASARHLAPGWTAPPSPPQTAVTAAHATRSFTPRVEEPTF